ncbi:MAG: head-tail adaptor protein [Pseudomonadota bacterium]
MIDADIGRLNHRIKMGRLTESENENGDVTCAFQCIKEVWAEIKPLPLTNYSSFGVSNESNLRNTKNVYAVKIRKNVLSKGRHEAVNAIVWKYKILTNFYCFRLDKTGIFLEGLFYDQGREL